MGINLCKVALFWSNARKGEINYDCTDLNCSNRNSDCLDYIR